MRKLTVKNFSVIKDAELEFGKITVLIGPQASGKSLLCKLAYFLGREVIKTAIDRVVNRFEYGFPDFENAVQKEFSKWFPRGGWGEEDWSIVFRSMDYEVAITSPSKPDTEASVIFNESFKSAYQDRINATIAHIQNGGLLIAQAFQSLAATEFLGLAGRGVWDSSTYIPLERSYFIDTKKGYRVLSGETEPISAIFADVFANTMNATSQKQRLSKYMGGNLVSWPDGWMLAFNDGRFLPLSYLSSGSKETFPILSVLDYYENQRKLSGNLRNEELYRKKLYSYDDFTIEEPEASVFPQTQYLLVREFAELANEINYQPHFSITTHSPYILSSFNNLLEAWQVAASKPDAKDEVAKLIEQRYWIKPSDFKAYCIHDGKLESIMDEETGLINGNYLDGVSNKIGSQFDELLRIGYVEA